MLARPSATLLPWKDIFSHVARMRKVQARGVRVHKGHDEGGSMPFPKRRSDSPQLLTVAVGIGDNKSSVLRKG